MSFKLSKIISALLKFPLIVISLGIAKQNKPAFFAEITPRSESSIAKHEDAL